jgi:hypothetical protein
MDGELQQYLLDLAEDERATPAALERLLKQEIDRCGRIIGNAGITSQ